MRRLLAVVLGALLWPSLVFAQGEIRRPALSPVDPTCTSSSAPSRSPLAGALLTCRDGSVYVGDGADWIGLGGGGSPPFTVPNGSDLARNAATNSLFAADAAGNAVLAQATSVTSAGVAASYTTVFADPNANLTWTADSAGHAGNDLQIEYVDPGMASQSLSASYSDPTLTISLATSALAGPIGASSLSDGGSGYSVNDTAFVIQVTGLNIVAVNQGTKTFTINVPTSNYDATYFNHILVASSTGNNGNYTVASLSGFDVIVNESIPSPIADGFIEGGSAVITVDTVSGDAIATYTVTDEGDDYVIDTGWVLRSITGTGSGGVIDISALDGGGSPHITTTAQDILDLGAYDGAPMSPALAPGSDGSGVVEALSPQNLAGGLEALNVTGPSWLDNGAITTNGNGQIIAKSNSSGFYAFANDGSGFVLSSGDGLYPYDPNNADKSFGIAAQGAGTINLNSDTVFGTLSGTGTQYACIDATGKLIRSASACGS